MKKRKKWFYRPATVEHIRRQIEIGRWDEAVYQAYKLETKELCAYLRTDLPLDKQRRDALADLIERRIQRKVGKGRKPGVIPSPQAMMQRYVISLTRAKLRRIRARHGGEVPRGGVKQALEQVCQRLGDDGNVDIDVDAVLAELRRRPTRR